MTRLRTLAAAGAMLLAGIASASAAPAAAPFSVRHYHLTSPAAPPAQPTPAPLFSLFGTPVSVQAPVQPPYSTSLFQSIPGQDGNDRTFPAGPPVQYID